CRASDIIQTQKSIMKTFPKEHLYAATINDDFLSYYDSSDEIQYTMKDDLVKTEKELNVITGDLMITYKIDKTGKLDKTNALQELKHITRNNLLHELEADFKFYNYLMIIT
ncbi:20044_t:CDS:1, partial [Racocetra persica]